MLPIEYIYSGVRLLGDCGDLLGAQPKMVANTTTVVLSLVERDAQRDYWLQHTADQLTVEAMMLDSQAAIIDQLERPEVVATAPLHVC